MSFDLQKAKDFVINEWNTTILESLSDYIRVPNQSPAFDPEIHTNGLQEKALAVVEKWVDACGLKGMTKRIITSEGRTPVIFLEIPATEGYEGAGSILCYSHLDKQPPMYPWEGGFDPYTPVVCDKTNDKGQTASVLYGRGGADDGYGIYATLTAIKAAQAQGLPHARIVMLTEFCEESGSFDLPYYLELLKEDMGVPDIVVCLDSGCGDYDRLWLTTSLRGMVAGVLTVQISEEGVHSGMGSGVIPSSFRIMRQLLDRIEDAKTGQVLVPSLSVEIPKDQLEFAKYAVEVLGDEIPKGYKFVEGAKPMAEDLLEMYLNRAWRPTLSYVGIGDMPNLQQAGNVLRPKTSMMLSFRLPPTADPAVAAADLKKVLEENPPYGAKVTFDAPKQSKGFYAPPLSPWLTETITKASTELWNNKPAYESCGGTIPFMYTMQSAFPKCQFCVCGLLGPGSNAHGPLETLHIPYFFNLTASMTQMFVDHCKQFKKD